MEQNQDKEAIIRAKQAISPAGLADQSAEGTSGPGSEIDPDELPADALEDDYMNGDKPAEKIRQIHPNPKPDIDKPSYS